MATYKVAFIAKHKKFQGKKDTAKTVQAEDYQQAIELARQKLKVDMDVKWVKKWSR